MGLRRRPGCALQKRLYCKHFLGEGTKFFGGFWWVGLGFLALAFFHCNPLLQCSCFRQLLEQLVMECNRLKV